MFSSGRQDQVLGDRSTGVIIDEIDRVSDKRLLLFLCEPFTSSIARRTHHDLLLMLMIIMMTTMMTR